MSYLLFVIQQLRKFSDERLWDVSAEVEVGGQEVSAHG